MNAIKMTALGLVAGLLSAGAQAAGGFYVENGYTGTAVFLANGGCKSEVAYENAVYGTVYNPSHENIGSGMVSADGDLLALLDEGLKLTGFQDNTGLKFSSTYYLDFSTVYTHNTFEANGACDIASAIASNRSRMVYAADYNKDIDKVTLKYSFTGYQPTVVKVKNGDTFTSLPAFKGSITFKGSRLSP